MSKPALMRLLVLRSTVTGFVSGGVMGVFFSMGQKLPYILTPGYDLSALITNAFMALFLSPMGLLSGLLFAAVFGGVLGLVGGLLLAVVTSKFFYPLVQVRLYRAIAITLAIVIAGGGAAIWGPLSFSSVPMTPISAITIGFSSVLMSLVAGWAAAIAAQDVARWYEQVSAESSLKTSIFSAVTNPGWIGVALLAVFGDVAIKWLACGGYRSEIAINCVPSPRLFTSVTAGFEATLPIFLASVLTYILLKKLFKTLQTGIR